MALVKRNQAEVIEEPEQEQEQAEEVVETAAAAEPETATPAPAASKAVASKPQTSVVSQTQASSVFLNKLRENGFEGLDIDWTSFPIIVLNQGEFETSDGNELGNDSFIVRVQRSRKRFVFVTDVDKDHEDDKELAYTYDTAELDDPNSELAQKVAEWKEEGIGYFVKEYLEAFALVDDPNCRLNGKMVLLQIPPTSKGRFSGFLFEIGMTQGLLPHEIRMRCTKGEKVKKAKTPFYPWQFDQAS